MAGIEVFKAPEGLAEDVRQVNKGRRVHLSYEGWPLVEQIEDVFCYLKLHANSGYRTTFGAVVVFAE